MTKVKEKHPFEDDVAIVRKALKEERLWKDELYVLQELEEDRELMRKWPSFNTAGMMYDFNLPPLVGLVRFMQASQAIMAFFCGGLPKEIEKQVLSVNGLSPEHPLRLTFDSPHFPNHRFVAMGSVLLIARRSNYKSAGSSQTRMRVATTPES